jgi:hypothetical protein
MSFLGANIFFHSSRLKHLVKGNGSLFGLTCTIYLLISWFPFVDESHLGRCSGFVYMHLMLFVCLFVWGVGWVREQLDDSPSIIGSTKQFIMSLSFWASFFFVFHDYAYFPYSPAAFANHPKPSLIFMLFFG